MENSTVNYLEEIPQLGGPHLKTCECGCNKSFYGRLNQKFMSNEHKAKVNNKIRSELNKPLKKVFDQMKVNYRLLERYFSGSNGKAIKFSELISQGFDYNSYFKPCKLCETGEAVQMIENYAFSISDNRQEISIYKI